MEPVIWVEVMSRHREVLARHRVAGPALRVGRAYDNEIVVDDPHVAPWHLRIRRDEAGRLVAEDLGSLNGLFIDGGRTRQTLIPLDGEGTIRIGQTWLRVREAGHPVAPERPVGAERRLWPWAIPLIVAILGIEALTAWLTAIRPLQPASFLDPMLVVVKETVGWVAFWTVLCRIFAGSARFERHLVLALSMLLAYSLYDEATSLVAFGLSWPFLIKSRYIVYWAALGTTAFLHMRIIGPGRLRLKAAGGAAVALAGIVYQLLAIAEASQTMDPADPIHRFYPPSFRMAPATREDDFLKSLDTLHKSLDREHDGDGA